MTTREVRLLRQETELKELEIKIKIMYEKREEIIDSFSKLINIVAATNIFNEQLQEYEYIYKRDLKYLQQEKIYKCFNSFFN